MCAFELIRFGGPDSLAQTVAADWLKSLRLKAGGSAPYCVALSGGRIASRLFAAAASLAKTDGIPGSVHFFWGDERCVPPDSPESNFGLARKDLFLPLGIPDRQVHRLRGEAPPEPAAAEGETELRALAPSVPGGQPVLDLVFLGMGEDGHVASLLPGDPDLAAAMDPEAPELTVSAPAGLGQPPLARVSLTLSALLQARAIFLLIAGEAKREVIARAQGGEDLPVRALIAQRRVPVRILWSPAHE